MIKITKRVVDTLKPLTNGRDLFVWDKELKGFGIRLKPSRAGAYLVQYRNKYGRTRRLVVGKLGVLTPDEARNLARRQLASVAEGADPSADRKRALQVITVSELCDRYLKDATGRIKDSTLAADRSRIDRHVRPLIGNLPVNSITHSDVAKLQTDIANGRSAVKEIRKGRGGRTTGGKGVAARTVGMFGTILQYAVRHEILPTNVARGIEKYPDIKKQRFLSLEEITALGQAMDLASGESKAGLAAIRLLLLTGCRRGEILGLQWSAVDTKSRCIRFTDTKSGPQLRVVGAAAVELLQSKPCGDESIYVLPSDRGDGHFIGLPRVLGRLCAEAKLNDVTVHTLRHTFAATAATIGFSELTIAGLLGHRVKGVTARYAHVPDSALLIAADRVAGLIAKTLAGATCATVLEFSGGPSATTTASKIESLAS